MYEYNNDGGIAKVKEYAYTTSSTPTGTATEKAYTYDSTHPDRLTSCGGTSISYNSMGCPTTYNGYTASWTRGKLTRLSKSNILSGTRAYSYSYNAFGQRIGSGYTYSPNLINGSAVAIGELMGYSKMFHYDRSGRLICESKTSQYYGEGSSTEKIVYLYDESGIIGMVYTSESGTATTYYFQRNLFGDVIGIYNTSGTKVGGYAYDAWGNCTITLNSDGSAIRNPIRYRGYYYDEDTKLYFLNARYYSPEWRRFISPDDTAYLDPETPNGLNLYAYCGNDPVNYADPSGYAPEWWQWALAGVAIAGAITVSVLTMGTATPVLAGMLIGGVVSAGFEIGSQVLFDGGVHDIGAVLSASLGGMVAGAISGIPIFSGFSFSSYIGTAILGGGASVVGGVVSGGVQDLNSALIAFSLGALGNVAAKAVNQLVVNHIAGKIMNISSAKGRSLAINNYMIKHNVKPMGFGHSTFGGWSRNLFKSMSKEFFQTVVADTTSRSAIVYSALISSSISGWY